MKITNQTIYIYWLVLKETDKQYFELIRICSKNNATVKITSDRM